MTRIAINGMGRIGRAAFKQIIDDGTLQVVAVNDLVPAEELADNEWGYAAQLVREAKSVTCAGRS